MFHLSCYSILAAPKQAYSALIGVTLIHPFANAHASVPSGTLPSGGNSNGCMLGAKWNLSCCSSSFVFLGVIGDGGAGVGSAAGPAVDVLEVCG